MLGKRGYVATMGESCIPPGMLVMGTLLKKMDTVLHCAVSPGEMEISRDGISLMAPCIDSFLFSSVLSDLF